MVLYSFYSLFIVSGELFSGQRGGGRRGLGRGGAAGGEQAQAEYGAQYEADGLFHFSFSLSNGGVFFAVTAARFRLYGGGKVPALEKFFRACPGRAYLTSGPRGEIMQL